MNNQEAENTIKEILEEDQAIVKKKKHSRGCFLRMLIILTLLFICVYGFILIRQTLLDLDAQAIVSARQTATARIAEPGSGTEEIPADQTAPDSPDAAETVLSETATPDPMMERTATIAAQLTSVAEFQSLATPEP